MKIVNRKDCPGLAVDDTVAGEVYMHPKYPDTYLLRVADPPKPIRARETGPMKWARQMSEWRSYCGRFVDLTTGVIRRPTLAQYRKGWVPVKSAELHIIEE